MSRNNKLFFAILRRILITWTRTCLLSSNLFILTCTDVGSARYAVLAHLNPNRCARVRIMMSIHNYFKQHVTHHVTPNTSPVKRTVLILWPSAVQGGEACRPCQVHSRQVCGSEWTEVWSWTHSDRHRGTPYYSWHSWWVSVCACGCGYECVCVNLLLVPLCVCVCVCGSFFFFWGGVMDIHMTYEARQWSSLGKSTPQTFCWTEYVN